MWLYLKCPLNEIQNISGQKMYPFQCKTTVGGKDPDFITKRKILFKLGSRRNKKYLFGRPNLEYFFTIFTQQHT